MLDAITKETGPKPTAAVIWMHGLGADGGDFAPIVPELDLAGLQAIRFVFPHAPMIPVTINGGYVMPAWYDILGTEIVRREDEAGIRASQSMIEELIAREEGRGIAASRIVLAGFSQGCAIALQTGLRHGERLAGLMCLSGYLPLAASIEAERSAANAGLPIFMGHGTMDPMIPLPRAEASRRQLATMGYEVEWHTYPMPHSVCAEELADISRWLRHVLA